LVSFGSNGYPALAGSAGTRAAGPPGRREFKLSREREGDQAMAESRHRPYWPKMEQIGRLLASVLNALAQLLDAIHRMR
jgi:hypothetical protein